MSELNRRELPHHRSPESHSAGRLLLAAVIVVLLVIVAGCTTWWMYSRDPVAAPAVPQPTAPQCPAAKLRVVAAPEIVPVVVEAARTIGPAAPESGGCGPVEVIGEEPWVTASAERKPDVWIPSSSAWLRMGTISKAYATSGAPIAWSPVMLVSPSGITGQFADDEKTTWSKVIAGITAGTITTATMPDPQRSTVGLLAVHAVNAAMARTTPDPGIAELRALTLRSRLRDATADQAGLLRRIAGEWNPTSAVREVGVFPMTEQQLRIYQGEGHTVRLEGALPTDGLVDADYPYAIAKATEERELADRLRAAIGRTALIEAGFRTGPTPGSVAMPTSEQALLAPARTWTAYRAVTTQVLLLIDSSGSMNDQITGPGGLVTTRAALLRESGKAAAQLFNDDSSVGLWFFGSPSRTSPAHTEAVSFGPITREAGNRPRRASLTAAMAGYRAPEIAGTPLYQSVLDATAAMKEQVKPDTVTLVVVLTDGVDGESRFAMPRAEFLAKLGAQRDAKRPVPVIAVGYGPDADMSALTAMASATGGTAISAKDPADLAGAMAKAFVAAHAQR